jgi:AcrR family transcriptional regulator
MPPRPSSAQGARRDTREAILVLAEKLFHERGFRGFSYADLARELDVKPAAIHYHFPGKDELGTAIIERIRDRLQRIAQRFEQEQAPWPLRLDTLFQYYRHLCQEHCGVCAIGVTATEADSISPAMQVQIRLLIKEVLNFLVQVLARGRDAGDFRFEGRAEDRATLIFSAMSGALQLQRLTGLPQLAMVIEELKQDLSGS